MTGQQSVVIASGLGHYQMLYAAESIARNGELAALVAGVGPPHWMPTATTGRLARLTQRRVMLESGRLHSTWPGELLHQVSLAVWRQGSEGTFQELAAVAAMRCAQHKLFRVLEGVPKPPTVLHYRSGFGGARALALAGERHAVKLCDHAIAHPDFLEQALGRRQRSQYLPSFWDDVRTDLEAADHIVVNSDFVRQTFIRAGVPENMVSVLYWGVDDAFVDACEVRSVQPDSLGGLRFLYAGTCEYRKGIDVLSHALAELSPRVKLDFEIVGQWAPDGRADRVRLAGLSGVRLTEWMPRSSLASVMQNADVFVAPSRAEGSARVVFEAMAAGCYVITTAETGSVVQSDIHGAVVPSGDAGALAAAIERANEHPDEVRRVGQSNAEMVRSKYRQSDYGDLLREMYRRLAEPTADVR